MFGNRIDEYVQDSQSAIAWETSRSINSLNRLDTETLGADQTHIARTEGAARQCVVNGGPRPIGRVR